METSHLVDPELVPVPDQFLALHLTSDALPAIHRSRVELFERQRALLPEFPDIAVTEQRVPGPPDVPDVRDFLPAPRAHARMTSDE